MTINNIVPRNSFTIGLFNQSLNDIVELPVSVTTSVVSSDSPTG